MLSVARVSAAQGKNYYAKDNYYTKDQGVKNSGWWGEGSRRLDLEGKVNAREFQHLLEGRHPRYQEPLTGRRLGLSENRRAGIDLTFSAPKSVSVAAFVGRDSRLIEAHGLAVDRALTIAERRYSLVRSGPKHARQVSAAGNLVVAKFNHDTSRALDPQLHTHCVVINACQRQDGHWRALHNDGFYNNSKFLGLIYQNQLAREVKKLGYDVTPKRGGTFEINGYTEDQLKGFSKRRAKIEETASNQKEARSAVLKDRPKKKNEVRANVLSEKWRKEAKELRISHPDPSKSKYRDNDPEVSLTVRSSLDHLSERVVAFKREKIEAWALENHLGRHKFSEIEKNVNSRVDLLKTIDGRFTTKEALWLEEQNAKLVNSAKGTLWPVLRDGTVTNQLANERLTSGQRSALTISLTTRDRVIGWQGVAGSGKSYALSKLRQVVEAKGFRVIGMAASAEATKVLAESAKIEESKTLASHLIFNDDAGKSGKEIWIVDEAGLIGSKDMNRLLTKAARINARVILVGDTRQLSGIESGSPFRSLQAHGMETAHLTQSLRQKDPSLKVAAALITNGCVEAGLKKLGDKIVEEKNERKRTQLIAQRYLSLSSKARTNALVISSTNKERHLLTDQIRAGLKKEGILTGEITTWKLVAKDLTSEQKKFPHNYENGDVIIFGRDYKSIGLKKGIQYTVFGKEMEKVIVKDASGNLNTFCPIKFSKKSIYSREKIKIAEGDRLKWTKNDYKLSRRNGQHFEVKKIEGKKKIILTGTNKEETMTLKDFQHIDHAIVSTIYSAQGKTVDHVIISSDKGLDKESMYTAITRARYEVFIYTEDMDRLIRDAHKSRTKENPKELLRKIGSEPSQDFSQRLKLNINGSIGNQNHSRSVENTELGPVSNRD